MKQRFGDKSMEKCEVMLKDIKSSERVNREVQKMLKDSLLQRGASQLTEQ